MSLFITFEGPEGGGKSTQSRLLGRALEARGYSVLLTREPGGTPFGETIREILLGSRHSDMLPETEALLSTAARAQHVAEVIQPALARGQIVLCDRFVDSTLAYQGAGRGLEISALIDLQRFALRGVWPDLTLLLDVPYETGLDRRINSGEPLNRFDADDRSFHERIRSFFLMIARDQPERWRVFDATQPVADLQREIVQTVSCDLPALADMDRIRQP